ncbi:alpha/beta hydrolase family protein [Algoriphagus sp. NG3]|uniref:alpha/beta hydrolase family protein n=1 Tax=Algoriphagus sp. NG3 TaxID=3097546 RepID=UPI002A827FD0|nr:alpha/beta fold hydrolase [Algoriphagus sp. NG3]WPR77278.1 alpha/beta fold hydrolase [Algoriphagus sp. NG3]
MYQLSKEPIMHKLIIALMVLLSTQSLTAQDIAGKWSGKLTIHGTRLTVSFNVSEDENGYRTTMDSPDQGVKDIPVTTTLNESFIVFEVPMAGITYEGVHKDDSLMVGTFKQNNQDFPLNLSKQLIEENVAPRPQEPTKPYPYISENVTFENPQAKIKLAGTLTFPPDKGSFPAVILISGSGPQNRDEELMGHKPFLVLSDYLTRNGIAVLRFDDRGFGESTGDFSSATTADFAGDVASAIAFLKSRNEVDTTNIGLIGHSEGGLIAPMVAAESADVGFIVLMAGSGIRGDKLLLLQEELIERVMGASEAEIENLLQTNSKIFDVIVSTGDDLDLKSILRRTLEESLNDDSANNIPEGMTKEEFISAQVNLFTSPWVTYFLRYDPSEALEKVTCEVLAINGEKDLQVPPKENLSAIKDALKRGGNNRVTVKEYEGLNHLFQESATGSPMEYSVIEQTIAPLVLQDVTDWIIGQMK